MNVNIRRAVELILKLHASHKLFAHKLSGHVENAKELSGRIIARDHAFSTYAKISKKCPDTKTYVCVPGGKKCQFFRKILRTY